MYHDPKHPLDSDLPDDVTRLSAERCLLLAPYSLRIREFLGTYTPNPYAPLPCEHEKACGLCRQTRDMSDYRLYRHTNGRMYRHSLCKACERELARTRGRASLKIVDTD